MRFSMPVYSTLFADGGDWCARPSSRLLQILHENETSARWIVKIGDLAIALGDPVNAPHAGVYIPQWILDSTDIPGTGEVISFECIPSESLPKATKLGVRVIGDLPEDLDVRELLEGALSHLGVLSLGQTIPVPAFENAVLLVEICEPEERVFLDGAEIALEVEREFAAVAPPAAAPAAAAPPVPESTEFPSMVPEVVPAPTGNRLGGGSGRSRLVYG